MSKEQLQLTHSERYVRKTNRIILIIGIVSFVAFLFGLILLFSSKGPSDDYQEPVFTADDDVLDEELDNASGLLSSDIEFDTVETQELPITTTPNPVNMGQVVLGTEAKNVLTIGTNGKTSIRIVSVKLAEPPFDGFVYQDNCTSVELRGNQTCNVVMSWAPVVAGNVQNNFIVSWHETNLSAQNAKAQKVPVEGNAITKEDCNFCEQVPSNVLGSVDETNANKRQIAYGPDGREIGYIDAEGYVYNDAGQVIGRVNSDGLIIDSNGNIIGVSGNKKLIFDDNGKVISHAYIAAGDKYTFDLPNGVFQPFFYYGEGWNPNKDMGNGVKGGFVQDESFSKDSPQTIDDCVLSYVLQLRKDGNFQTKGSSRSEMF